MFSLQLLIGLISSKKLWKAAKKQVTVLKGGITIKMFCIKSLRKSQRQKKDWIFVKGKKLDFEKIMTLEY